MSRERFGYEYCNGTIIKPQLVGLTEGLTACKRACQACMAWTAVHSTEKRRLELELRSLNFRIFMLIFICFVVVIVILKERSDLNWLASVPLPACLDYALPQSTADNAYPCRLFCSFQVGFCLIRWSVKFGIVL